MRTWQRSVYYGIVVSLLLIFTTNCAQLPSIGWPKSEEKKTEKTETSKPQPQPDVNAIIQKGVNYREAGQLKKAIASFEKALEVEPGNAEAARYLAETENELDDLIQSHFNKGIAYFNQDALEDAIREWDKVLELDPSHQKAAEYKDRAQQRLKVLKNQE